jgi:hypothetical protein
MYSCYDVQLTPRLHILQKLKKNAGAGLIKIYSQGVETKQVYQWKILTKAVKIQL